MRAGIAELRNPCEMCKVRPRDERSLMNEAATRVVRQLRTQLLQLVSLLSK